MAREPIAKAEEPRKLRRENPMIKALGYRSREPFRCLSTARLAVTVNDRHCSLRGRLLVLFWTMRLALHAYIDRRFILRLRGQAKLAVGPG